MATPVIMLVHVNVNDSNNAPVKGDCMSFAGSRRMGEKNKTAIPSVHVHERVDVQVHGIRCRQV